MNYDHTLERYSFVNLVQHGILYFQPFDVLARQPLTCFKENWIKFDIGHSCYDSLEEIRDTNGRAIFSCRRKWKHATHACFVAWKTID